MKPIVYLSGEKTKCGRYRSAFYSVGFDVTFSRYDQADALCLCGGGDVAPCLYGEVSLCARDVDIERDGKEFFLLRKFLESDRPIMAICRGMQLVNVYFGGSLIQNVCGHSQINGSDVCHPVRLYGSLKDLYGDCGCVNSAHHQAIGRLGYGLNVTAVSADGIIEGFERKNVCAYQFHPERLRGKTDGGKIFAKFYYDNFY